MAIPSSIGSTSKVAFEFFADTAKFDTKKLEKVAKELEKIDEGAKTSTKSLKSTLEKAMEIARVPFMNDASMKAASRIIKVLANDLIKLKEQLLEIQTTPGLEGKSLKAAVGAQMAQIKQTQTVYDEYVKGYQRSKKAQDDIIKQKQLDDNKRAVAEKKAVDKLIADRQKLINQENRAIQKELDKRYNIQKQAVDREIKRNQDLQKKQEQAQIKLNALSEKKAEAYFKKLEKDNNATQNALDKAYLKQKQQLDNQLKKESNLQESYAKKQIALLKSIYAQAGKSTTSATDKASLMALAQSVGKFDPTTIAGQQGLSKATNQFGLLTTSMAKNRAGMGALAVAWDKFKIVFGRVIDALGSFWIINTVQNLIVGFGKSLINSNSIMQTSEARLKSLLVTTEKFTQIQKHLQDLTISTPFDYQQILEASAQARAFGVEIAENMKAIADWASATNKDLTETATAFGKIVNYSPRTALLLSTRGLSKPLFDAYVTQYKDRELALRKLIEDNFSGMARKLSNTWQGMMANLSDVWVFISQKLGEPIFQKLNNGLTTTFYLLKQLNAQGSNFLSWAGSMISYTASFATMFGLAVGIKYLITNVPTLITWMGKLLGVVNLGLLKTMGILGYLMFAIDTVLQGVSTIANKKMLDDLQSKKTGSMSSRDELEHNREILALQEKRYELLNDIIFGNKAKATQVLQEINATKEKISLLESVVRLQQRENALIIARGETLSNYENSQLIEQLGIKEKMLKLAQEMEDYVNAESKIMAPIGESKADKEARLDELNFIKAKSIYMKAVAGGISKDEALSKLKQQMIDFIAFSKKEGNPTQAVVEFITEFTESLKGMGTLLEKTSKAKALTEYRDRLAELADVMERIKQSADGVNNKTSKAFGKGSALDQLLGSFSIDKNLDVTQIAKLLEGQYDKVGSADNKEINKKNENILQTLNYLNTLQQTYASVRETAQRTWEAEITKIEAYNDKVREAKRNFEDFRLTLTKENRQYMSRSEIQELYNQSIITRRFNETSFDVARDDKKIDASKTLLASMKEENELFKMLHENSTTFGEAYYRIIRKINREQDALYDTLANMSVDFFKESGTGIIRELLYGNTKDDLNDQLLEAKINYDKIVNERLGIIQITDTEAMALAKVNELEEKRANWILPTLEKSLQSVTDKMTDILLSDIAQRAMSGFIDSEAERAKLSALDLINSSNIAIDDMQEKSITAYTQLISELQIVATQYDLILAKILAIGNALKANAGIDIFDKIGNVLEQGVGGSTNPNQDLYNPQTGTGYVPRTINQPRNKRMTEIVRNTSTTNSSNYSNQVVFNGPVYGMDDFKKKVNQANKELSKRLN